MVQKVLSAVLYFGMWFRFYIFLHFTWENIFKDLTSGSQPFQLVTLNENSLFAIPPKRHFPSNTTIILSIFNFCSREVFWIRDFFFLPVIASRKYFHKFTFVLVLLLIEGSECIFQHWLKIHPQIRRTSCPSSHYCTLLYNAPELQFTDATRHKAQATCFHHSRMFTLQAECRAVEENLSTSFPIV